MRVRFPALLRRLGLLAVPPLTAILACGAADAVTAPVPPDLRHDPLGLLFHLSGDEGTKADFAAGGRHEATFVDDVTVVPDGAHGPALRCGELQRLAWRAPGNIFAPRGTISFFWRARFPVGPTAFPLFRVGFADHSSWDMVFLRIDWNGGGYDAFVTDTGLARVRVSTVLETAPAADAWTHLAFAWDETIGVRLYVNGKLAAAKDEVALLDAGLDQFGPFSRIISPHQVQSDYNYVRGGDIDELSIYDHMLGTEAIARVAAGDVPKQEKDGTNYDRFLASRNDTAQFDAWLRRYGWNRAGDLPPLLPGGFTAVRKVEIHDAYDVKRWWWKACDGIRETTWPGVYNRSRLAGRNDYFQLPDWDCYVDSGKSVTFTLPDEPWNHLEITGAAWGKLALVGTARDNDADPGTPLAERPRGPAKTVHRLATERRGGFVRFTNVEQETPLEEFAAYNVTEGREPAGQPTLAYDTLPGELDDRVESIAGYVFGRFQPGTGMLATAVPRGSAQGWPKARPTGGMPCLHVLIPATCNDPAYDIAKVDAALDGVALDLPPLAASGPIALNIRIKDPLWPARDLADFSFTVGPNEPHTLWFDLRDRLLPPGRPLYLTIAASAPVSPDALAPVVRLVFKPRAAGLAEHVADRFTQVRDVYAQLVEEHPHGPELALWVRFENDLRDLLRVAPDHELGRKYAAVEFRGHPRPPFTPPEPPVGTPRWAFWQAELVRKIGEFVNWYIDHRQSAYGDLGGGLSDDTDLTNLWPAAWALGLDPEKVRASNSRVLEATFANGMWSHGLSAIQTDELHSYEEGVNALGQMLIAAPGSPRELERAMATTRALEGLAAVNPAGHRHVRSTYFSGEKFATEAPWGGAKAYSHLVFQPAHLLADFNGQPRARKLIVEVAEGLLAHRRQRADGRFELASAIDFATDAEGGATRNWFPWPLFWNAWQWTGERRFLHPIFDGGVPTLTSLNPNAIDRLALREEWGDRILRGEAGRAADGRPGAARSTRYRGASGYGHFEWQITGDKRALERTYAALLEEISLTYWMNTEGSLWIDRVGVPNVELQRARLGGVALARNSTFPGHAVRWEFTAPARPEHAAILIPDATEESFTVLVHNLDDRLVEARMIGAQVAPGRWEIVQGVDANGDDRTDGPVMTREREFARDESLVLRFPPHVTSVLKLRRVAPATPYWERPDLGLDPGDVTRDRAGVHVRVHSLGSVPAPARPIVLRNAAGAVLALAQTPALEAPLDLVPRTGEVVFPFASHLDLAGATVEIDPDRTGEEITRANNRAPL